MSGCEGGSCATCPSSDPDRLPPGMLRHYDINQSTADGTLVCIETEEKDGVPIVSAASTELAAKASEMTDGRVLGVVFGGPEIKALYSELFGYGIDTLYHVRDKRIETTYMPEAYADCIGEIAARTEPAVILFPATQKGREVAPRLAATLHAGLTADCTDLRMDGRKLIATRPAFGGTLIADIACVGFPQMATVRPGAFPRPEKKEGEGTAIYWQYSGDDIKTIAKDIPGKPDDDITKARILIALGDGIKDRSLIGVAESVASKMDAEVCCSRALVEKGWMPRSRQVGLSGRIVSPDVYIAFGISGAVQHRVGMNGAGKIIAVNSDASAPIHGFADLSLLADAGDVLRAMDASLRLLEERHGRGQDLVRMTVHADVAPCGLDDAVLPDEEGGADDAHRLLPIGDLGAPGPDFLHQHVVGIAEELHLQTMSVDEPPMRFGRIPADPDDGDVPQHELREVGGEGLRLFRASGCAVLRIEVYHIPDALERRAVEELVVLVFERECR